MIFLLSPFFALQPVSNGRRRWAQLRRYTISNEESVPQTESAVLSLQFRVRKHHVHQGRIHVR